MKKIVYSYLSLTYLPVAIMPTGPVPYSASAPDMNLNCDMIAKDLNSSQDLGEFPFRVTWTDSFTLLTR